MLKELNGLTADQFVDRHGRRVLTDEGLPGMNGIEGTGSSTEVIQCQIAAVLFNGPLDLRQLNDIKKWLDIRMGARF